MVGKQMDVALRINKLNDRLKPKIVCPDMYMKTIDILGSDVPQTAIVTYYYDALKSLEAENNNA